MVAFANDRPLATSHTAVQMLLLRLHCQVVLTVNLCSQWAIRTFFLTIRTSIIGDMCRYPYKRVLTLTNSSKLPCKCEVMGQESRSQNLATFTTEPNSGVIPGKGTFDVEITMQASRLGRIQLPLQIKVNMPS